MNGFARKEYSSTALLRRLLLGSRHRLHLVRYYPARLGSSIMWWIDYPEFPTRPQDRRREPFMIHESSIRHHTDRFVEKSLPARPTYSSLSAPRPSKARAEARGGAPSGEAPRADVRSKRNSMCGPSCGPDSIRTLPEVTAPNSVGRLFEYRGLQPDHHR